LKTTILVLLGILLILPALSLTEAEAQYWLQVGAWGDSASKGNSGVQAEIRTKLRSVTQPDISDSFWVGDKLEDGAFIQFGYEIEPGHYCIKGRVVSGRSICTGGGRQFGSSDARWFWQYWPDAHGHDYYYASGPIGSVGPDDSWHTYSIVPNVAGSWDFVLDSQPVDHGFFTWTRSKDVVFVAAEKITSSSNPGALGPVEFRNVAYLTSDGWHQVNSLFVLRGCGYGSACIPDIPYGVQVIGPNYVVVGTGQSRLQAGQLLWGGLTLRIAAPPNTNVLVDGVRRSIANESVCVQGSIMVPSCVEIPLQAGWHTVTVDQLIQIDSRTREMFSSWNDGWTSTTVSRYMDSDITLHASYVTQYLISLDFGFSSKDQSWRDRGKTASFSISTATERSMEGPLGLLGGKWVFSGWYEDGNLVATSRTANILVDGPHTLVAQWQPNVVTPTLIFILLFGAAIATWLVYRRRNALELKRPRIIYCINCGVELPPESRFCNKCGSAQS
jgi:uncharacterized repeat protein (TIGR02543 family)